MRYAYTTIGALLLGGATATLALQPGTAQVAQNEPGTIQAAAPRGGAPMSFADLVQRLSPAVVNISTKQTIVQQQQANPFAGTPFGDMFGFGGGGGAPVKREGTSLGSGFLISPDGYVVTNNHVIAPGARGATVNSITVTLQNRKEYTARVIGKDLDSDLALLKIDAAGLPFVKFGDSSRARVGDWVVAIGEPFGLGGTVTAGIISAINRATSASLGGAYDRYIQTDAAINQGNSGGPMFDLNGNVIGINNQIIAGNGGGNVGIGLAIPAEIAKPIIETMMKGGTIRRGYLDIKLGGPVTDDVAAALGIPKGQGELIADVTPGGPGARGGLRAGDVVTRVNGTTVNPDATLSYLVSNLQPGQSARFDLLRNGKPTTITVTPTQRPSTEQLQAQLGGDDGGFGAGNGAGGDDDDGDGVADNAPTAQRPLGLTVQPLTPGIARAVGVDATVTGVVIASVDQSADAGQKLQRGDVVSAVNNVPVRTAAEFSAAVAQAKAAGRAQVLLRVTRKRVTSFVPVRIASN